MSDDWDFIKRNKPVVTKSAELSLELSLGQFVDDVWCVDRNNPAWNQITVEVIIDDTDIVYSGPVTAPVHISHWFADTDQHQDRCLYIVVKGLDQLAQRGVMVSIRNLKIEKLSLDKVVEFTGIYVDSNQNINTAGEFMGKDGITTIPFSTPIYIWLFENQHHFI